VTSWRRYRTNIAPPMITPTRAPSAKVSRSDPVMSRPPSAGATPGKVILAHSKCMCYRLGRKSSIPMASQPLTGSDGLMAGSASRGARVRREDLCHRRAAAVVTAARRPATAAACCRECLNGYCLSFCVEDVPRRSPQRQRFLRIDRHQSRPSASSGLINVALYQDVTPQPVASQSSFTGWCHKDKTARYGPRRSVIACQVDSDGTNALACATRHMPMAQNISTIRMTRGHASGAPWPRRKFVVFACEKGGA
jgi:hypothetical protein